MFGKKTILSIFALIVTSAGFASAQSVGDQWKANEAKYAPLFGQYLGKVTDVTDPNGDWMQIQLVLVPVTQLKASSTGTGTEVVTSVAGRISTCAQADVNCFADPSQKNNIVPVATFTEGSFDAQSKQLSMIMTPVLIGDPRGGDDVSDQLIHFEGIADGQQVVGKYWTGISPQPTNITFKKQ